MSGALLARSRSLPASLSRSTPRSLLLSFRGLISLAKALAPDHWLLLKENNYVNHGMELIPCTTAIIIHYSQRRKEYSGDLFKYK